MKHPGPWKYGEDMQVVDADGCTVIIGDGESMINTADAAKLVMAAPELLATLKRIKSLFTERRAVLLHPEDDEPTLHEAIDLIASIEQPKESK